MTDRVSIGYQQMILDNNKKTPCKGCEERHPGCHADCEGYLAWKAEYQEKQETIKANYHEARYDYRKSLMTEAKAERIRRKAKK